MQKQRERSEAGEERGREKEEEEKRWGGCVASCPRLWQRAVDSQLGPQPRFLSALTGKT